MSGRPVVLQITVLEFELRGLLEAPDRDAPRGLRLVKSDRPGFEPPDLESLRLDLADLNRLEPLDIRTDYRRGPLDQVVAGMREVLGTGAPADDPLPAPERRAHPAAPSIPPSGAHLPRTQATPPRSAGPAMRARTEPAPPAAEADPTPAQLKPALKAAAIAMRTKGGNGFRVPSKKAQAEYRNSRAPPR